MASVSKRGGVRKGAGRKPSPEPLERHTITILKSQAAYLRTINASLSHAIRTLITAARTGDGTKEQDGKVRQ